MKPAVSTDRVAYPDVSHELVDLVSQQPAPEQAPGVKVKRLGMDEYRALQAAGLTGLDRLTRRDLAPFTPFGFVPRPASWKRDSMPFHSHAFRTGLQSAAVALRLCDKLQNMFGRVGGQIEDVAAAAQNVTSLLPDGFAGLIFGPADQQPNPEKYIQERSLGSVDEMRSKLDSGQGASSMVEESLEKATALLQLRLKLVQLSTLGNFVEQAFRELDSVDLGRLKKPQLC
jgi:hypothetical protein